MEATAPSHRMLPQLAKYEVLEEIGHGGMATVYRARDRRLGREVAVKIIHPHLRGSREIVSRFDAEARAVAKLRHPNIVDIFDVSEPGEPEQYLVAELMRGTTLRKILDEHGAMPAEVAASLAVDLLSAVMHANTNGVVHRDIKPENVLIEHHAISESTGGAPQSDRVIVKLTDFGIAKVLDTQGMTSTGQVLGSPAHMAPEQIEGAPVDARADVFGMGVLLYECMVGHLPFEGSNPAQVLRRVLEGTYPSAIAERPVIGSEWSALLDKALAHTPAARFDDAGAMRDAVTSQLAKVGVESPRGELARWLDDPQAYEVDQASTMISRLVTLGEAARAAGDPIAAAGHYNRALAHAPDDPELLRLVASLQVAKKERRSRRKVIVVLLASACALGSAVGLVRNLKRSYIGAPRVGPAPAVSEALLSATASALPVAPPSASFSATPPPSARPTAASIVRPSAPIPAAAPPSAPPKAVERAVRLDLTPSMGVKVSIDGAISRDVATGDTLQLDGKGHALVFSCPVCYPVTKEVPASDKDETVVARLSIKPATLEILGDGNKTYQIVEHPEVPVRVGSNNVALSSEFERVTVKQIESGASVSVRLHAAYSIQASF